MLKVRHNDLESIKKQLEKSIEVLIFVKTNAPFISFSRGVVSKIDKQIKQNRKQITLLKDEYYIN